MQIIGLIHTLCDLFVPPVQPNDTHEAVCNHRVGKLSALQVPDAHRMLENVLEVSMDATGRRRDQQLLERRPGTQPPQSLVQHCECRHAQNELEDTHSSTSATFLLLSRHGRLAMSRVTGWKHWPWSQQGSHTRAHGANAFQKVHRTPCNRRSGDMMSKSAQQQRPGLGVKELQYS